MILLLMYASIALAADNTYEYGTDTIYSGSNKFDDISDIITPKEVLNVSYPTADVCLGDVVAQTKTIVVPKVYFNLKPNVYYTLIMIDPDVPSAQAPVLRNYLVWMKINISLKKGLEGGDTVAGYISPVPYPGSGYHRYIFLLYEQDTPISTASVRRFAVKRYQFNLVEFAYQYGLNSLVAGNFFRTRIPALNKEPYCNIVI